MPAKSQPPTHQLARKLWDLWDQEQKPDVQRFLTPFRQALTAEDLAAVLRVDQHERWRRGEYVPAEGYLFRFPSLKNDPAAFQIVYDEILLRQERGEVVDLTEYFARFPNLADRILSQAQQQRGASSEDTLMRLASMTPWSNTTTRTPEALSDRDPDEPAGIADLPVTLQPAQPQPVPAPPWTPHDPRRGPPPDPTREAPPGQPPPAYPDLTKPLPPPARRTSPLTMILCVSLVALAGALGAGMWYGQRLTFEKQDARAATVVESLAGAEPAAVPLLLRELEDVRAPALPHLEKRLPKATGDRARLNLTLGVQRLQGGQEAFLVQRLVSARPEEVGLIRDALAAKPQENTAVLWGLATDRTASDQAGRPLRLAAALAVLDTADGRWKPLAEAAAAALVREPLLRAARWADLLRPVRHHFREPLNRLAKATDRPKAEQDLAAALVKEFESDVP